MPPRFARTPEPPYYAVIFSAQHTAHNAGGDDAVYNAAAARMGELVGRQPGFLGVEYATEADGFEITVAYFDSEENIRNWKMNAEHLAVQREGRKAWYEHYEIRVAKVERAYNIETSALG
jgi:heme-degrading monooxygenase HmoA